MEKPELRRDLTSGELQHYPERVAGLKMVYETRIILVSLMFTVSVALLATTGTMSVADDVHAQQQLVVIVVLFLSTMTLAITVINDALLLILCTGTPEASYKELLKDQRTIALSQQSAKTWFVGQFLLLIGTAMFTVFCLGASTLAPASRKAATTIILCGSLGFAALNFLPGNNYPAFSSLREELFTEGMLNLLSPLGTKGSYANEGGDSAQQLIRLG